MTCGAVALRPRVLLPLSALTRFPENLLFSDRQFKIVALEGPPGISRAAFLCSPQVSPNSSGFHLHTGKAVAGGGFRSPFLSCAILRAALHVLPPPPPVPAPVWGTLLAVSGGTLQGGRLALALALRSPWGRLCPQWMPFCPTSCARVPGSICPWH